jgi:hypothetical protein
LTKVYVYVEGPSDKAALQTLLAPLLDQLREKGVMVIIFGEASGDRKKAILLKVPERAVNILHSQPRAFVVALPDLYPKNRGFPHETYQQLAAGILESFRGAVKRKKIQKGAELERRFRVYCFKHDMESLVLASYDALKAHLGTPGLKRSWSLPVEDVDHDRPPKRVVEEVFQSRGQRYKDTVDAPLILSGSHYSVVAEECPQCFKPFVEFLSSL